MDTGSVSSNLAHARRIPNDLTRKRGMTAWAKPRCMKN
jgi:hypothetical protein